MLMYRLQRAILASWELAASPGNYQLQCAELTAHQLLWSAPGLLLGHYGDADLAQTLPGKEGGAMKQKVVRQRVQAAELEQWVQLLRQGLHAHDPAGHPPKPAVDKSEAAVRRQIQALAVRKAKSGCLRSAAQMLRGATGKAPASNETLAALQALVADTPPGPERQDLQGAYEAAAVQAARAPSDLHIPPVL